MLPKHIEFPRYSGSERRCSFAAWGLPVGRDTAAHLQRVVMHGILFSHSLVEQAFLCVWRGMVAHDVRPGGCEARHFRWNPHRSVHNFEIQAHNQVVLSDVRGEVALSHLKTPRGVP